MNEKFINKLEETDNINNSDFIPFEKVKSDGTYLTNKISYFTLNTKLSTDISNIFNSKIKNLENQTNIIIFNINNKLDKRGLIYSTNNKMIGTLVLNSQLSVLSSSHFNKDIFLNYNRIINLTADEFTEDYDAVNKRYVDLKFISLSFPNFNNLVKKTGDTMNGFLSSSVYPPIQNKESITKQYIDNFEDLNNFLPLSGGTLTGSLSVLNPNNINNAANKNYVDSIIGKTSNFLPISGGKLSDILIVPFININSNNYISDISYVNSRLYNLSKSVHLSGSFTTGFINALPPIVDNEIATKKYVDDSFSNQNFLRITGGTLTGNLSTIYPNSSSEIANKQYTDNTLGNFLYLKNTGGESNNLSASTNGIIQRNNVINLTSNGFIDLNNSNFYTINLSANCSGFNTNIDSDKFYKIDLCFNIDKDLSVMDILKDSNNNLYFCNRDLNFSGSSHKILKVNSNLTELTSFQYNITFSSPKMDSLNNIYYGQNNSFYRRNSDGVVTGVLNLPNAGTKIKRYILDFYIDETDKIYILTKTDLKQTDGLYCGSYWSPSTSRFEVLTANFSNINSIFAGDYVSYQDQPPPTFRCVNAGKGELTDNKSSLIVHNQNGSRYLLLIGNSVDIFKVGTGYVKKGLSFDTVRKTFFINNFYYSFLDKTNRYQLIKYQIDVNNPSFIINKTYYKISNMVYNYSYSYNLYESDTFYEPAAFIDKDLNLYVCDDSNNIYSTNLSSSIIEIENPPVLIRWDYFKEIKINWSMNSNPILLENNNLVVSSLTAFVSLLYINNKWFATTNYF